MSKDAPHTELGLPFCEAARDKPIRIEYSLMCQLINYTRTGRATLGGLGTELYSQEPNKYMGLKFQEGLAALLGDLIPDGVIQICLEGSETPSSIRATEEGDYWWVGVKE
jgi:hypothetical protein